MPKEKGCDSVKTVKRAFGLCLLILIAVCGYFVYGGYVKYTDALGTEPLAIAVARLENTANYTAIDDIPQIYRNAVIATEDRRFYKHSGFDLIGICRAIYVDIKTRSLAEGGSTITQQLAKNMYFPMDYTPQRKFAETFMAVKMEQELSKDKILELYMNGIYYGSGYYCIYDASMGYFGKIPSEMSDYECTLLAGIPNAPSVYSPKVNPELAYLRQEKVVDCMAECNYITESEAAEILADTR